MRRVRVFGSLLALVMIGSAFNAEAQVPELIRYQGILVDSQGAPIDGSYNLTFRIYDAASAGTELWSETQSAVPVSDGAFSVLLGQVTVLDLVFDKDYWLSTEVGSDGEMSPRQQLTSVAYAYRAAYADNAGAIGEGDLLPDNLLTNNSFEEWSTSNLDWNTPPNGWSTYYASAVRPSTTVYKLGGTAVEMEAEYDSGHIHQTLAAGTWEHLKGQNVTAAVWARSTGGTTKVALTIVTDAGDIAFKQDVTENWQLLTVSWTLPQNASWVKVRIYPNNLIDPNDPIKGAIFDGAMFFAGSSPLIYISEAGRAEVANRLDSTYASSSVPLNHLRGGSFESWSLGSNNKPDGWGPYYNDPPVQVTGVGNVKYGASAMQLGGTNGGSIRQSLTGADCEAFKGKWVCVGGWVKSSTPDAASITVTAVNTNKERAVKHSGSGQWEYLMTTLEVPSTETWLLVSLGQSPGDTALFDGACLFEGQMPYAFCPNPADSQLSLTNYKDAAGVDTSFQLLRIESGTVNLPFNGANEASASVTFASSFNMLLGVVTDVSGHGSAAHIETGATTTSTSSATILGRHVNGGSISGSVPVFYLAIGVD